MKKLAKLVVINLILAMILSVIPEGKIELSYTINNEVKTITLASLTKSETMEEVEEVIVEIEKNYNLTLTTDLRTKSNLHAIDYDTMLQGTNLEGIGKAIEQAEQNYSVNGLYLMGLCIVESGWGTSPFAINRNNLVGWNAVDNNPSQATTFESKEDCILHVAQKLQQNYLTENGAYFEGYTAPDIDVHYCTDKLHANKIVNVVNELIEKI
mgnify:CR=1 FL=1